MIWFAREDFNDEERAVLAPHFTNLDGPVFALVNLPEVTKGALFARYSRSPKSLRRLFLDEFADQAGAHAPQDDVGAERAEDLYKRIFVEYGDDSVAQLGGAHLACEQSSQILAKVLEWGRLGAYLEQSTRYVPYDDRPSGRWRYLVPPEAERAGLAERFVDVADRAFETYARWLGPMQDHYREAYPKDPSDSDFVYRMTIRAKACDALRGLLPAATRSNVGIFATGQSYEQLLLRMRAHPLEEVNAYADMMLAELRKVIPAFLRRVDVAERGGEWSRYLAATRELTRDLVAGLPTAAAEPRPDVTLTEADPEGEVKVVAAALYTSSGLPDDQVLALARTMSADERARVLAAYVGDRRNRRHRPGRAFERTAYRFDVLCDYGAFRDLQRHRMLTIEWQGLSPEHGYDMPRDVAEAGAIGDWNRTMRESAELWGELTAAGVGAEAAQYAVSMAYRIRFVLHMNAREAMHLIELRSSPQGHPTYRRIAHEMHRLIAEEAGHRGIAETMRFVDRSDVDLERLEAERRSEAKRRAARS